MVCFKPTHEAALDGGYGWVVVGASFMVHFVALGLTYSFGVFFLPMADEFNADRADTAWIGGASVGIMLIVSAFTGRYVNWLGARKMVAAGGFLVGLALVLTSYVEQLWLVYIVYGIPSGIGLSLSFIPGVTVVQTWFEHKRGLAAGLAVAGSGAGGFVFPLVLEALIDSIGWRRTLRYEGLAVGATIMATSVFIIMHPPPAVVVEDEQPAPDEPAHSSQKRLVTPTVEVADKTSPELSDSSDSVTNGAANSQPPAPRLGRQLSALQRRSQSFTSMDMVYKSRTFRLLMLANFWGSFGYGVPFFHIVPFAEDRGIEKEKSALILAMFGISSLAGRVLLGIVADRFGRVRVLQCSTAIMGVMSILWPFAFRDFSTLMLYGSVYGFNAGAFVSLPPALAADYFGVSLISSIIGMLFTANAIPSMVGPVIAGLFFDQTGSYAGAGVFTGITLLGATVTWAFLPSVEDDGELKVLETRKSEMELAVKQAAQV